MAKIENKCAYCGKVHFIERGEYNYWVKRGRTLFFCSRSCSAKYNNQPRKSAAVERTLVCPVCNNKFTTDKPYEVTFCSRSCASKGSLSEYRLQRMSEGGKVGQSRSSGSVKTIQHLLKQRESWKYDNIRKFLESLSEEYEFEYVLSNYVFDLALPNKQLLIEFDGKYHSSSIQRETDLIKEASAIDAGWEVVRISTDNDTVIDANLLIPILARYQPN